MISEEQLKETENFYGYETINEIGEYACQVIPYLITEYRKIKNELTLLKKENEGLRRINKNLKEKRREKN